ncbi:nucleotidyl cyclase domain-containing protein [Pyxidicoccus xibeiensis]|uniref:GGDEF domain-containing protein n=1 Tax=Pyxidicoccus xibeiensis TaxID=2906759 RepID=UPI0020A724FA|nr:GGDEF domain-containing protein [Pyxidicoccus xibeiensis]MCP3140436.1 GGDEF domain-containing protein [Pyxidicoccus xibeiensis]
MPYPLDDATATALIALNPWVLQRHRDAPVQAAVELLLQAEQARRGHPDAKTGALQVPALTQGSLLKEEYDLSTHAHHDGWRVGAVIADVQGMIHVNARFGFATGDAVLRATAESLAAQYPGAKVLRVHPDAFAALLVPTSQLTVREDLDVPTQERLARDVRRVLPEGTPDADVPAWTVSLLELTVDAPSHWQVLGPLVWAELERTHVMVRTGRSSGLQRRRLRLDGFVPAPATP